MRCISSNRAFTLVELSIVLVILGLLVGGVLAGQSLIRASEIKSAIAEFDKYKTAIAAFKDKYFAIPGDMPNAVKYWGAVAGGTADGTDGTCTAYTTPSTGTATCNGSGNGLVNNGEVFRSWHHLANAGMVDGFYNGVANAGGGATIGVNVPRSKLSPAGWMIMGRNFYYAGDAVVFAAKYGNLMYFGTVVDASDWPFQPVLKAEEAYNIDAKVDDGRPHLGKVLSWKNALRPNCIVAANDAYDLANTNIGCHLEFITGF